MSHFSGDFDNVDLNLLPILQILIETRSVTRTAARLSVSQSSVSRSLTRLREQFCDPLLVKTNMGMSLTRRAEAIGSELDRWLATTRTLLRTPADVQPASFTGTFRISSTDYGVLTVLMPSMQTIMNQAPDLRLEVEPLLPDNLTALSQGAIDIVITGYDPEPGRTCERFLYAETYHCVFREDHPLVADRQDPDSPCLSLDDLTEWSHVAAKVNDDDGDPVCARLAELGRSRRIACRIPYFSVAPHILLSCDAIMVMPRRAADHFTRTCALTSLAAPVELEPFNYWILWHERGRRDPAIRWLIDCMAPQLDP